LFCPTIISSQVIESEKQTASKGKITPQGTSIIRLPITELSYSATIKIQFFFVNR
jgi:hypothetical protein